MKRLTCEMCGSTDLIKEGGVFVCQTCGCKYSVEDAKKMMVEGTVQVTGTVKIDHSEQVDNSLQLARRYLNEGNDESAEKYFELVLMAHPNNWEAAFYSCYCHAKNCRIRDIGEVSNRMSNALPGVLQLIKSSIADPLEQKTILKEIIAKTMELAELLFLNAFPKTNTPAEIDYVNNHLEELFNRFHPANRLFYVLGDTIADGCSGEAEMELLACDAWEKGLQCHSKYVNGYRRELSKPMVLFYQTRVSEIKAVAERRKQQEQQARNTKYWEEHAAEKAKYDARISEIAMETRNLMAQVDQYNCRIREIKQELSRPIAEAEQLRVLQKQQYELTTQKNQLGLFAGKQKKALQAQIDFLQIQIDGVDAVVKRLKKEIQDDVNARVSAVEAEQKPVSEKINALEKEKISINTELAKDR